MKIQKGFTLLEVAVVLAIISVLQLLPCQVLSTKSILVERSLRQPMLFKLLRQLGSTSKLRVAGLVVPHVLTLTQCLRLVHHRI